MYATSRHGYAKHNHDSWMARRLNAPRSANSASTPVNANNSPPRDFHPWYPFLTRYAPAKYGLNAFNTEWSYCTRLYIPETRLNSSHTTTMGANPVPSLEVPNGWTANKATRMAHEMPTMADRVSVGSATVIPWMAPSTDCAGVSTPSARTRLTPSTPMALSANWAGRERSRKARTPREAGPRSLVARRSSETVVRSRGESLVILVKRARSE